MPRHCDLMHRRPTRAVLRLRVKSTRAGRPGHPLVREYWLCAAHARELRRLGLEVIGA